MIDLIRPLAACGVAAMLALGGCGPTGDGGDADGHGHAHDGDGHDHDGEDHDGHDHDGEDHDEHDHDGHGHGHDDAVELGSITLGESTIDVDVVGDLEPGALLHFDLTLTDGPAPSAIRVWIGDADATGALKAKAMGSDGRYHGDVEMPTTPGDDDQFWIEFESRDGQRVAGPLALD